MSLQFKMLDYILETPEKLRTTLESNLQNAEDLARRILAGDFRNFILTGIGSGYTAGLCTTLMLESACPIPTSVVPSSAILAYPDGFIDRRTLVVALSRSGEKGFVLEATRHAQSRGAHLVAVTSNPDSLLAAEAAEVILSREGEETSWPKTKSTICMAGVAYLLAACMCGSRKAEVLT